MEKDYIKDENDLVKNVFNLDNILEFQMNHEIQIIRGADLLYECHINRECVYSGLTPVGALVIGIVRFKIRDLDV